ncbi:hypothetical protein chiPu_0021001 [Chiloscyllium punctatum]|uniref:Uncharacterized protein n=1 Tax=Chiloscyllium punctatum TaxID=137246 RepID=A0A401RM02_CHIPU|nr:hypothetical protein [Chiloscyllium punctatum]
MKAMSLSLSLSVRGEVALNAGTPPGGWLLDFEGLMIPAPALANERRIQVDQKFRHVPLCSIPALPGYTATQTFSEFVKLSCRGACWRYSPLQCEPLGFASGQ